MSHSDHSITDESLMLAYGQGDIRAFETLYERHKGAFYRYFIRQVGDQSLSEDLYQELWSRVIKSATSYQVNAKWTTWAYRIAHNLLMDHFRSKPHLTVSETLMECDDKDKSEVAPVGELHHQPEQSSMNQQLAERLTLCIEKLPQVQKETFLLTEETDMTAKQISEVVSASLEAVKSRLRYARTQLQDCLAQYRDMLNKLAQ